MATIFQLLRLDCTTIHKKLMQRVQQLIFLVIMLSSVYSNAQDETGSEWITAFEKSDYSASPDYETTMEYFSRLSEFSEYARMFSFGKSPQNRDLNCLIISQDKIFDPVEIK